MWSARLLFTAQLLVCRLATDAPPADSATSSWEGPPSLGPASIDAGTFGPRPSDHVSFLATTDPPPPGSPPAGSPRADTASVPPSVMLRLGNFTIDSTKSFRVPQAPAPATPTIVDLVPYSRSPAPPMPPEPHVVVSGAAGAGGARAHHHHDRRYGPTFEDAPDGSVTRVTAQLGDDASLNCRISLLQDKTVSWVRRRGTDAPELLTVGAHTYAADSRVSVARRYPGNWRLIISDVRADDEGIYECQISTHPPRVSRTHLHVNSVVSAEARLLTVGAHSCEANSRVSVARCYPGNWRVIIGHLRTVFFQYFPVWVVDEAGAPLLEKYYEAESTLALVCRARAVDVPVVLAWLHEGRALNADTTRGGISVRTEQVAGGADSTLRLARVNASDAGNYTCAVRGARPHTVAVHVLNEESLAELHAGAAAGSLGVPAAGLSLLVALSALERASLREPFQLLAAAGIALATLPTTLVPLAASARAKSELLPT